MVHNISVLHTYLTDPSNVPNKSSHSIPWLPCLHPADKQSLFRLLLQVLYIHYQSSLFLSPVPLPSLSDRILFHSIRTFPLSQNQKQSDTSPQRINILRIFPSFVRRLTYISLHNLPSLQMSSPLTAYLYCSEGMNSYSAMLHKDRI